MQLVEGEKAWCDARWHCNISKGRMGKMEWICTYLAVFRKFDDFLICLSR